MPWLWNSALQKPHWFWHSHWILSISTTSWPDQKITKNVNRFDYDFMGNVALLKDSVVLLKLENLKPISFLLSSWRAFIFSFCFFRQYSHNKCPIADVKYRSKNKVGRWFLQQQKSATIPEFATCTTVSWRNELIKMDSGKLRGLFNCFCSPLNY